VGDGEGWSLAVSLHSIFLQDMFSPFSGTQFASLSFQSCPLHQACFGPFHSYWTLGVGSFLCADNEETHPIAWRVTRGRHVGPPLTLPMLFSSRYFSQPSSPLPLTSLAM
jgi:hypothetical protein